MKKLIVLAVTALMVSACGNQTAKGGFESGHTFSKINGKCFGFHNP